MNDMSEYERSGQILSVTTPVAKKKHQCGDCKGNIVPGERYIRMVCAIDNGGGIDTSKRCYYCETVRLHLEKIDKYYGDFGTVADYCSDDLGIGKDHSFIVGRQAVIDWLKLKEIEARPIDKQKW